MKNKKVIGIRLFGAVCVIMIAICMITQGTIKNEDKKPESAACIISGKTLQDICSSAKRIFDGAAAAAAEKSNVADGRTDKEVWLDIMQTEQESESQRDENLIVKSGGGNNIETEYLHIDNKFYLKIPKNFKQLDYDTIIVKYSGDVPDIVYSNDEININIAISLTENRMRNSQIKEFTKYMENLFEGYTEIVDTNYYTVSNHNIGQIKLTADAIDTRVYNNMIYFSYNDKLVIVAFNCTDKLKDEWSPVGDFIIDSLFFEG